MTLALFNIIILTSLDCRCSHRRSWFIIATPRNPQVLWIRDISQTMLQFTPYSNAGPADGMSCTEVGSCAWSNGFPSPGSKIGATPLPRGWVGASNACVNSARWSGGGVLWRCNWWWSAVC
ncbi:hypothetical protein FIBSPDRAFT_848273 [Athelia psychrophila]|uniref:Secreted protein n=1 Tax=Athelia psychrophila TaxID=1759441 RepID=A0A166VSR6_9AGAM|nr:hypothetical protein FIBSPDRAFT_848273 [Fibularhizoctonia sp. CBS 109695]